MSLQEHIKRVSHRPEFWFELDDYVNEGKPLDFSPWGMATVSIPDFFRECVARASREMDILDFQYTDTHGTDAVKKAITATFAQTAHFPNCDPNKNVALGMGAIGLTEYILHMYIRDQDDELLTFEPIYPNHFQVLRDKGVGLSAKSRYNAQTNRFELDLDDFRSKLSAKTKAVVLCNPNNPTGRIYSREEYQQLTDILNEFPHVKVIEDAAYCVYINGKERITYFHELDDNIHKTFTVFSAGKIFNTTGNRLGWTFAHEKLVEALVVFSRSFFFTSAVEQKIYEFAFIESVKPYRGFPTFWEFHAHDNAQRLAHFTRGLDRLGIKWMPSEGSYYVLFEAEKLVQKVEPEFFHTYGPDSHYDPSRDAAVCRKLFLRHKIGSFPLSKITFNAGQNDAWIRGTFNRAYEDLDLLLSKLELVLQGK